MSLKVDKVQLEIIMKSDTTRVEIRKLEDQASSLKKEMGRLAKGSDEYVKKSEEYSKVKRRIEELKNSIALTGMTMKELQDKSKSLSMQLRNLTPGSADFVRMQNDLKQVNERMKELRGSSKETEGSFSKLAGGFNKYFNIGVAFAASITGASLAFRKLAEDVAHMDDVYSDVMKTTGRTREEVLALNEEFKKMDTRTSRESLNLLARDAGKLGIEGTKNILDFVDAGNQINVALGEDLGEDAIKNIGKMVGVFENSTKQLQGIGLKEQMLAVGSAVNELGATSTASEPYLVSFAGRLGGISKQAKISMADILGYASALDQDMQAVEMSATALQNFIMKVMGEPAKFAQLAGLEVEKFSKLLETDANAAIKQVLRALNEKGGFQALIPIFQEMGLDGARATGVLSAMAGSIDKIDEAQRVANTAMSEGTSITKEYAIKNNNLAAELDKARKKFTETALELGESLNPILLKSTKGTTYLIKTLVELPKWLKENKGLIITLASVMAVYTVAVNRARLSSLAWYVTEKLKIYWTKASTAATLLQTAVTNLFTGSVTAAKVATKAFFATLGLNPFVAIGVAVAAMTIGLYKLLAGVKKVNVEQKLLGEISNSVTAEIQKENIQLEAYRKRLAETEPNSKERVKLVAKLNELYPDLLAGIDAESASVSVLNGRIKDYIKNMADNIRLKVLNAKITEKISALEDEKDYTKRTKLGEEIEFLKKQYEYQLLVVEYGEENAKLVSKQSELEQRLGVLRVQNQVNSFESFEKMWRSQNERRKVLYTSAKAEQEALNAAYNDYKNTQGSVDADIKKTEADLKKIKDIVSGKSLTKDDKKTTGGDAPDLTDKEKKKQYDKQLKLLQDKHNAELAEIKKTAKTTAELKMRQLGEDLEFYKQKLELAKKYGQNDGETERQIETTRQKIREEFDAQLLKSIEDSYKSIQQSTDNFENTEKQRLVDNYTTKKKFQLDSAVLEITANEKRLEDARTYADLIADETFVSEEKKQQATERANAEILKAEENLTNSKKKYSDITYQQEEEYQRKRQALIDKYGLEGGNTLRAQYRKELTELKNALDEKLLTEEEYQAARRQVNLKAAEDYARESQFFAGKVANVVSSYHQFETDSLEAEKQKQLSIAGNDAAKREAIELQYAQKELDLKKKQADANLAIGIAQAFANGALGITEIWSKYASNPILAGILTAGEGIVIGLQIGSLIAQRKAIKATTLNSSSTSTDSTGLQQSSPTGNRVAQAADGRYDVIGAQDGRQYKGVRFAGPARTGLVRTPTLYGEAGTELVISAPDLRRLNMKAPGFNQFVLRNTVMQRAEGNYAPVSGANAPANTGVNDALIAMLADNVQRNNAMLQSIIDNGVKAPIVLSEFERKQELRNKSVARGSLR